MSGLHYKKDGTLDMRYSSSRAAMSSSSGGYSGYSSAYSSYARSPIPSSSSSNLHYKKDGTLDMRYSSSRAAMSASSGGGSGYSGYHSSYSPSPFPSTTSSDLHYKKDGTLDMRYSSSRAAVSSSGGGGYSGHFSWTSFLASDLHYKKDGTLDMRYNTSRAVTVTPTAESEIQYKKDGTPDMRFKSSRALASEMGALKINPNPAKSTTTTSRGRIPDSVPRTKSGLPDMRTAAGKAWVREQAVQVKVPGHVPDWVPRKKDGAPDMNKAVAIQFFQSRYENQGQGQNGGQDFSYQYQQPRAKYYAQKLENNSEFSECVQRARQATIPPPAFKTEVVSLPPGMSSFFRNQSTALVGGPQEKSKSFDIVAELAGQGSALIDLASIQLTQGKEGQLGAGGFGVVRKGLWRGRAVAVKQLHLNQFTVREKKSFVTEVRILTLLSRHPNLVTLLGYSLDPPSIILDFVPFGSLSQLLHYAEDPATEAKITDGRVKKNLVVGIAQGMRALHELQIVHGDLKPANVLVTADWTAQLADFGLATIRGKTSATVASRNLERVGEDQAFAGGTAVYMAPELLDLKGAPELSSDVYSFGVIVNEVIEEVEPYGEDPKNYVRFHGRGPFAAVQWAKLGNRPRIGGRTPIKIKELIEQCWTGNVLKRPDVKKILERFAETGMDFPNSC